MALLKAGEHCFLVANIPKVVHILKAAGYPF